MSKKISRHEMTEAEHVELLDLLKRVEGSVVLSGYASPLYDSVLAGWERHEFEMPNHAGQGRRKQRRQEVVWVRRSALHAKRVQSLLSFA